MEANWYNIRASRNLCGLDDSTNQRGSEEFLHGMWMRCADSPALALATFQGRTITLEEAFKTIALTYRLRSLLITCSGAPLQ